MFAKVLIFCALLFGSSVLTGAMEVVHFQFAEALQAVGGRNSDYIGVGVEIKFGW